MIYKILLTTVYNSYLCERWKRIDNGSRDAKPMWNKNLRKGKKEINVKEYLFLNNTKQDRGKKKSKKEKKKTEIYIAFSMLSLPYFLVSTDTQCVKNVLILK